MISWILNIKTVSESNCSDHWTKKSKRHKQQQFFVRNKFNIESPKITLPCTIKMIRLAPRVLDTDNLVMAFKWIRDELSECIFPAKETWSLDKNNKLKCRKIKGRSDSDPRITWLYDQETNPMLSIRIEISSDQTL